MARKALTDVAGSNQTISGLVNGVTRNFQVLKVQGDKVEIEIHTATSGTFKETVSEKDIVLPGEDSLDTRPRDSRYYEEQAQANLKANREDNERLSSSQASPQTEDEPDQPIEKTSAKLTRTRGSVNPDQDSTV